MVEYNLSINAKISIFVCNVNSCSQRTILNERQKFPWEFPFYRSICESLAKEKGSTMWMFAISSKFVDRALYTRICIFGGGKGGNISLSYTDSA